jgi:hypothetical protein
VLEFIPALRCLLRFVTVHCSIKFHHSKARDPNTTVLEYVDLLCATLDNWEERNSEVLFTEGTSIVPFTQANRLSVQYSLLRECPSTWLAAGLIPNAGGKFII